MSTEIPKTMKAIRIHKTGGLDVIVQDEVPVPTPKEDEVLIKVQWTGTNFIDTYIRSGLYPRPLPFILGGGLVGKIAQLPSASITSTSLPPLKVGQVVLSNAASAFAEYAVAPWFQVAPLPEGVSAQEGVHLTIPAYTAAYLARESYPIRKGDWVLVRAAAGGVGLLLVQIAKYLGANVIGTVSTEAKAKEAKDAGADHVLLTTLSSKETIAEVVRLADGKGVHGVYDGVGKDTWEENFELVRPKGTIVTYGNSSGAVPAFEPLKLMPKCLKITRPTLAPFVSAPEDFADYSNFLFKLVQDGALKLSIHKIYPFTAEGVAESQKDIASRSTTGKLLIKVAE